MSKNQTVAILGASDKPERYANKAQKLLREHGHTVIPVHPTRKVIDGIDVIPQLSDIKQPVDTLTLYLGADRLKPLIPAIVGLKPRRVIFNPGTESDDVQQALSDAGIAFEEACTLVLLNTGQFDF